jgi:hypothetical protein
MHKLSHLTLVPPIKARKICHAASGSHAAEKTVGFYKQGFCAVPRGTGSSRQACRATANDDDIIFASNRQMTRWLQQCHL